MAFVVPQSALAEEKRKRLRNGNGPLQKNDGITEAAMTSDLPPTQEKGRASSTADSPAAKAAMTTGTPSTATGSAAPEVVAAGALRTAALQVTDSVAYVPKTTLVVHSLILL